MSIQPSAAAEPLHCPDFASSRILTKFHLLNGHVTEVLPSLEILTKFHHLDNHVTDHLARLNPAVISIHQQQVDLGRTETSTKTFTQQLGL